MEATQRHVQLKEPRVFDVLETDPPSVYRVAWTRFVWLAGLLVVQSVSSVVLERHKEVLQEHLVITLFLTMLVGAGGNAGSQVAVTMIRNIATGRLRRENMVEHLLREASIGVLLTSGLFVVGFLRVRLSGESSVEALAIALSLLCIVSAAVLFGAAIPLVMHFGLGLDPAHAGATIQVVMDVMGVTITIILCDFMFSYLTPH